MRKYTRKYTSKAHDHMTLFSNLLNARTNKEVGTREIMMRCDTQARKGKEIIA
jgi:hypothetical protein